ncbi:hypothetical protein TRL7639_01189 [Falsiruegeria litorea R37]|uniref:glutathione transferase n=1 Tax=Falsiruegeria litorea R37 TaxID=1200284 RepID=A0A1Y5RZR8_9RHOB|nr:glutathione S-transferase family protein [Falsiruegeria litorea]SLN29378.1 hypothetical protein TRL7639_01189 [Falsiruegeria litorea R37]
MTDRGVVRSKSAPLTLIGYRYSVYTWIVRAALHLKATPFHFQDFDPFTQDPGPHPHPFGRVPVLQHGAVSLFETVPICGYVDAGLNGPSLTPSGALARARAQQVAAIIDNYGYWPMIRQVFAHRVFRPLVGEEPDEATIAEGLTVSAPVLAALEKIAEEGLILTGATLTLADCHLAPMVSYFGRAPEGKQALSRHPALARWWAEVSAQEFLRATDPMA